MSTRNGKLYFTVDYPALYSELIEPANIANIGVGALGLRLVLLGLKGIAENALSLPASNEREEILRTLSDLGIVDLDAD